MSSAIERFDDKARDAFDQIGQNEVYVGELLRHRVYTRFLHWMVALFFFLALFTGFSIYLPWLFRWFTPIFGGGPLSREMHPWFGLGFVIFFGLQMLNWIKPMTWTAADTKWMRNIRNIFSGKEKQDPPETGFFNAGQKAQFWEIVGGCAVYLVTGIILWAGTRTFGRWAVAVSYILHDISADHHAGRNLHSHLSQHDRRARDISGDDSRRSQRGVGLDVPSCVVQRDDGA